MVKIVFSLLSALLLSLSGNSLWAQDAAAPVEPVMNDTVETSVGSGDAADNKTDTMDAADATADDVTADDEDFAFGTVVSVSDTNIVILEYNFDSEEEVQMTYDVNGDTKFENVTALKEIVPNDEVEINFKEVDGKKMATFISKDLPIEDDSYLEDSPADESAPAASDENSTPSAAEPTPTTAAPETNSTY
jgi:hypothetical protein